MTRPAKGPGGRAPSVQPINVLRVGFPEVVYVRFLGSLRQLGTHYAKQRPLVCFGASDCPRERHKLPYRSKWYAPAQSFILDARLWRSCVVEVTEALERKLRDRELRGELWCLKRLVIDKKRKQLDGDLIEVLAPESLPRPFDVDPVLRRCFNELTLPEPARNLLPDRPFSLDEEAPAPACLAEEVAASMAADRPMDPGAMREKLAELRAKLAGRAPGNDPRPQEDRLPPIRNPLTNGVNHAN